jgi:UDP-N-acetyl-D-mannosaminuronic acid dehydrogenase
MANTLPPVLHLTKEDVDIPEKRLLYTVGLVGCGQKALSYGLSFAEAGFRVICTDADQSIVKRLSRGSFQLGDREAESKLKSFVRTEKLVVTSDLKTAVSGSNVIIITVSARIDPKKGPDYAEVENVCKQIGAALSKGSLVVYTGVAGFGIVQTLIKETLENTSGFKVGEDLGLAYNPINNFDSNEISRLEGQDLKIAANDKYSLTSAFLIFETIAKKGLRRITDIKTAEIAALFSSVSQDVSAALANELAVLCESARIDYAETVGLLDGACKQMLPSIREEDNRNETYFLLDNAENLNVKIRLPLLARQINEEMVKHALNLTQDALRVGGKTLRRAKVALLGAAETGTGPAVLIEHLEAKGAKISRYDPFRLGNDNSDGASSTKKTLNETVEGTDCVIILKQIEQLNRLNLKKLKAIMKSPAALVDLAGLIEPAKAENEGFIYRGIGRGVWKK